MTDVKQEIYLDVMKAIFENQTCSVCGNKRKVYPVVTNDDGDKELWCESCIERN